MEKRVLIDAFQKVTDGDMTNISLFPEQSIDDIVKDIGITGQGFSGFPVIQSAPSEVTVGNGRFYQAGLVYFNNTDGGQVIELLSNLPIVTRRIVAIVTWGTSVAANVQPRTFLTDPVTRASVARAKSTEQWRWANLSVVNGVEGPDPVKPSVADNVCVVAWVTLSTTGVVSIEMALRNMVPSVTEADTRLDDFDAWRATAGSILATLRSDLSALAARFNGLAPINIVIRIAQDVARLKQLAGIPTVYSSYDDDYFINATKSDTTNVDYLAKIEEGVHFADAAVENDQLGLLNPLDPNVISSGNMILPTYTKLTRITQIGTDLELNISNYANQTCTWLLLYRSRTRLRTGYNYILGSWSWEFINPAGYIDTFFRAGDSIWAPGFGLLGDGVVGPGYVRVPYYWYDQWWEPYWEVVSTTEGINGSVVAETFMNAQAGYLLEVGLYFSRAALTGDVHVALCETTNGAPDTSKIIARANILVGDIKVAAAGGVHSFDLVPPFGGTPTPTSAVRSVAQFTPTLLAAGKRYAIVVSTPGNHYLWLTKDNKYTDGTLFTSTDGAWFLGDLTNDIAFDLVFAQFSSPRVEIQMQPLQLAGGIVGIDINADTAIPNGAALTFQVQIAGVWKTLSPDFQLTGQPAILPMKAVFDGTSQVMPQLGLLSNSRQTTNRPRSDFTHISTVRNTPACLTIRVSLRVEAWRDTHDTILCTILTGGSFATVTTPTTTTVITPIDDANARIINYVFTVSSTTTYKIKITGTIDNVATPYVISERVDVATNP
jgi:hypothetical protein